MTEDPNELKGVQMMQESIRLNEEEHGSSTNVVELSTHLDELPVWQPLPPKKKPDPAKRAQRKRAKQSRKKNR